MLGHGAPRWLWIAVVFAAIAACLAGGIGVVLAMLGVYRWWAVVVLTIVAVAAVGPGVVGATAAEETDHESDRAGSRWAIATVAVVVAIAGWSASRPGHYVITAHDPGVYASTAALLGRDGGLRTSVADRADEPLVAATLETTDGASVAGPGAYEVAPGTLEYQFSHAPSTIMSVVLSIGGPRLFFGFGAVITAFGLLAVYLLATRFVPSGFAFAAVVALALAIPVLYVSRSTYSEPFTLLAVNAALGLACRAGPLGTRRAIIAGFLFGSSVLFRIDGQLIVIAMIAVGVVAASSGTGWRPLVAGLLAAVVPAAVGLFDLAVFSTPYWENQTTYGSLLILAGLSGIAIAGGLTFVNRNPSFERRWATVLGRLAGPAAALTAGVLAWAWLVRPSTQVARAAWETGSNYAQRVEGLQTAAGLAADGTRSYAELTVASLGWYLGAPLLALAVVGLPLMVWRSLRRPSEPWGRLVAFFVVAGSVYLIDWQITPYQPWAARRFVTVVLPVFAIAGAVGAAAIVAVVRRALAGRDAAAGTRAVITDVVGSVLMVAMVVPALIATWPVRDLAEQRGFYEVVQQACESTGRSTVLGLGSDRMTIPMRAWCDVPSVSITGPTANPDAVRTFADTARSLCMPAVVMISDSAQRPILDEARSVAGLGEVVEIAHTNTVFPEESVDGPPSRYRDQSIVLAIAPVILPDSC